MSSLCVSGWKSNRGEYERYHEGYGYGCHNYRGRAYSGHIHGDGNVSPRRQDGIGNFSIYAKYHEHHFYDSYGDPFGRYEIENGKHDCYKHRNYECHESYHDSLGVVDWSYDKKAYGESLYDKNFYGKGYQSELDMHDMKKRKAQGPYLEWERKVEELFQVYDLMEKDKVSLALESFTHVAIGWWESTYESRRKRRLEPIKT
ncbi:hypothetical protein M9H77_07773 [Catharanthus roseus]|uniref:Uncharacterized protein n=1 Tax=Catharanthus roseus TaxID=4058 RepID=A0ACC0BVW3_CATRO|nr:hypothetical protein M9H77_07773 [Catharanthus roseus]